MSLMMRSTGYFSDACVALCYASDAVVRGAHSERPLYQHEHHVSSTAMAERGLGTVPSFVNSKQE
jgi:hypothetical protein